MGLFIAKRDKFHPSNYVSIKLLDLGNFKLNTQRRPVGKAPIRGAALRKQKFRLRRERHTNELRRRFRPGQRLALLARVEVEDRSRRDLSSFHCVSCMVDGYPMNEVTRLVEMVSTRNLFFHTISYVAVSCFPRGDAF